MRWSVPDAYFLKLHSADITDRDAAKRLTTYDRHPLRAAYEVYRAGARVRGKVARIECPTLVLHGRRDHVCSWRNAEWLAAHVASKDVTVRVYDRSAHVVAADVDRDAVAEEVIAFLRRLA
jgi:carboxylesterase